MRVSKDSNTEPCNIYLRAKQTHDSFLLIKSNICENFYFIYRDLWGLYKTVLSIGASYFLNYIRRLFQGYVDKLEKCEVALC